VGRSCPTPQMAPTTIPTPSTVPPTKEVHPTKEVVSQKGRGVTSSCSSSIWLRSPCSRTYAEDLAASYLISQIVLWCSSSLRAFFWQFSEESPNLRASSGVRSCPEKGALSPFSMGVASISWARQGLTHAHEIPSKSAWICTQ